MYKYARHVFKRASPLDRKTLLRLPPSRPQTTTTTPKREGDISDAFASLSGRQFQALEPRFSKVKKTLIIHNPDALQHSFDRLLRALRDEIPLIASRGPSIVPQIDFSELDSPPADFTAEHKKCGVAIVRNILPDREAEQLKADLKSYIAANPSTKAFPPDNPQVYELYWSPSQMAARMHPSVLRAQRFLLEHWHSKDADAPVSLSHPVSYADRLRMRRPGDKVFALGPHVDGGSVERWEEAGYGRGGVYDQIFAGRWESYDPWEISCRLPVVSDLYGGIGACSMFRACQGWLALSAAGPGEGTLLVNPLLGMATAYYLLRPFFYPQRPEASNDLDFLHPSNWSLNHSPDSWLQGATPGHGQELTQQLHPHLQLAKSMVHIPRVEPGDYVSWHTDTIHSVDSVHRGTADSSVLYIPSCPLTELNVRYLVRQRDAFLSGVPGPDFPGGEGEKHHMGRPDVDVLTSKAGAEGLSAFGFKTWDSEADGLTIGQWQVMNKANKILGFYD